MFVQQHMTWPIRRQRRPWKHLTWAWLRLAVMWKNVPFVLVTDTLLLATARPHCKTTVLGWALQLRLLLSRLLLLRLRCLFLQVFWLRSLSLVGHNSNTIQQSSFSLPAGPSTSRTSASVQSGHAASADQPGHAAVAGELILPFEKYLTLFVVLTSPWIFLYKNYLVFYSVKTDRLNLLHFLHQFSLSLCYCSFSFSQSPV